MALPPTFQQLLAAQGPTPAFGGASQGVTVQSTPTAAGVSPGSGGSVLPTGSPVFGGASTNPGATGTTTPTAAQTAATAQAAALAKATTNYQNGLAGDMSVINQGIITGGGDYSDFIKSAYGGTNGFGDRQTMLNQSGIQNELSRDQGLQGVRDMVSNGVQGGGVVLDNDNAGTSSAGDALARAYGIQGRQQASGVGNQYIQGQNTINSNQGILNHDEDTFNTSTAPAHKQDTINTIVSGANQTLTYLNAIAQGAGVTDLPAIQQQIDQVKAQATAALSAFDSEIGHQQTLNTPSSQSDNQATAQRLFTQGTAPAQAFNFTNVAPAQLQGTGPAASSLPIYIAPSNKNTIPTTA